MYLIERPPLTDAMFLAGSVTEPSASETEWVSGGTYAVGAERTRTSKHRVYKCAVARSPSTVPPSTTPPEDDKAGWQEMRPTDRYLPFGPYVSASGKTIYRALALESTTADLTYRMLLRYCNAIALFGLRGAWVRVRVWDKVLSTPNVLTASNDFSDPAWVRFGSGTGVAPVVTPNAALAPDGTLTADQIIFSQGAGGSLSDLSVLNQTISTLAGGSSYGGGVWLRSLSGPAELVFRHAGGSLYKVLQVTGDWVRFGHEEVAFSATSSFEFGKRGGFGASGGSATVLAWGAALHKEPLPQLVYDKTHVLKRPSSGYWDYAFGQKVTRDRLLIPDLPIYPGADVRIDIGGSGSQQRRVSQIEFGKLRYIPGATFGGTEYGVARTLRARLYREQDDAGNEAVLLAGASQDLQATVVMEGDRENAVLPLLRSLVGKGVAVVPHLSPGYEQSLVFGAIDAAPVKRTHHNVSQIDISVRGLPVD